MAYSSRTHFLHWLLLALLLIACDQAVKYGVSAWLPLHGSVEVTPWFSLVHVLNPGAAFSFLAQAGGWQRYFFTLLGLGVCGLLLFWLWRGVSSRIETLAYIGLIGGAMGNVLDRIRIGAVVDYLDLHWQGWHWPAFNLADVFVIGGAVLLVLASARQGRSGVTPAPGAST
ncbi:lipoprotein signal peptidase [Chitinimonas prasina]|uniref:Lipoprotein signal peptidase n=1 Tax=Chitinimonas prasina TaxID=1434937 RepID=A0ABQ5YGZ0_9NEIS|nr:signal peptidase II [Chitinimonas prasina]GLR14271.1 lipoprotein signal peptidase [Chitinimonas prasina]